ncbi:MAG TPA: ABC transporter transmembrane domain-containing protein [Bacteroidia bacterium]|jgi:ABC-type multidrug transport system fused ATPase/permease subunit|nr:ABC transporter transmembrane domain-containing protein [Bacteroidia bacterium]
MAKRGGTTADKSDDLPKAKLSVQNFKRSLRLFSFVGKHKWKFFVGLLFLGGTVFTALVFPKLIGNLMGLVGNSGQNINENFKLDEAYDIGIKLLVLFAFQAIFSFFRVVTFTSFTEHMLASIRQAAYQKLIQMPMSFFSERQVAELNSRMASDITQISETFTTNIAEFLRQFIIIIGGTIIICMMSWKMALVMLSIIPIIAVFTLFFSRYIRKLSKQVQDKVADANVITGEGLQGISNVKTFTNESFEINRYNSVTQQILQLAIKGGIARGAFFSFVIFCLFGAIIFIVYIGITMTLKGELPAAQMMSFLFYTVFVAASIGGIAEQVASIQRALGATERVMDIIDGNIEKINLTHKNTQRVAGNISFENVKFFYPSRPDFTVLKNVSFKVNSGEMLALVGPSGSGKSTIASLLLRFYELQSGKISIDGKDISSYDLTEYRNNLAIVPQDVLLFGGTIKENITYGKLDATDAEIIEAARQANAFDFIESFPDKFETKVGERGIQLSGGQRQRIAIARAILKNPSILILDEATSSLDSESERLVQEALDKLMQGRTSIVIAHRLSTIRNADKIIVLENGLVRESGTHNELSAIPDGLYRSLSRLQFDVLNSTKV